MVLLKDVERAEVEELNRYIFLSALHLQSA